MRLEVVWYSDNPDAASRGYWDQGWLEAILRGEMWRTPWDDLPELAHHATVDQVGGDGAVVVVPARWHADRWQEVQEAIRPLAWVLLVLTGDEENSFPRGAIEHPRMLTWVQTPAPGSEREGERYVVDGTPPLASGVLSLMTGDKDFDWYFAGQINTPEREQLRDALWERDGGEFVGTNTFGSGVEYGSYLSQLARARVAPCPGGPFTPDTFRLFEAMEAGCAPVVRPSPYWELAGNPPLTVAEDWDEGIRRALDAFPDSATRASAWWQRQKRELARRFWDDVSELSGDIAYGERACDLVTVLMPTSSAPGDPDTAIIEQTVASVQERLPGAELIVMMDGLHHLHKRRRAEYAEYRRRVAWLCEHRWSNALPVFHERHTHQAEMTRLALGDVHTPFVLFVEHDAPLVGEIPFGGLVAALRSGRADAIRLHHEASVLPDHRHMMLDEEPQDVEGVPLLRTSQWSQRPHLANASLYRRILREHFTEESRTMIEDVLHGQVDSAWREFGLAGWDRYRLWMYAPDGDMKRSTHLDSRAGEPKVPMKF